MRYVKQPHRTSCGPVALMNAIKWAGGCCTIKHHYQFLQGLCEQRPQGMYMSRFKKALTYVRRSGFGSHQGFTVRHISPPTISDVDDALDRGCALILRYSWYWKFKGEARQEGGHYVFVTRRTKKMYEVVNESETRTVKLVSRKEMIDKLLSSMKRNGKWSHSNVWVLTRKPA